MSYPFNGLPPFARNQWYIAAWSGEIGPTALPRTILGQNVVLYRQASGQVVAVSGHCPHRWMPLGKAAIVDDAIVCPYHGARFDGAGRCSRAPLDQPPPASFVLKAYPIVERGACVWIWPGDPARADVAQIPDTAAVGLGPEGWRVDVSAPRRIAARAQLLIENLFDQSHMGSVHPQSLGGAAHADQTTRFSDDERCFAAIRTLAPIPADDMARAMFPGLGAYLMAQLRSELFGVALINSVGSQTFSTDEAGNAPRLVGEMNFLHAVTPETATSCHYFTAIARNFAIDNADLSVALITRNAHVVQEDIDILEAIEARIDQIGDPRAEASFASDAAAMRVRLRMKKIIAQDDRSIASARAL